MELRGQISTTTLTTFLGISWDPETDRVLFPLPTITLNKATKRSLLREISTKNKTNWDDPLNEEEASTLKKIRQTPEVIIRIPRVGLEVSHRIAMDVHDFVDASEDCVAACVYMKPPRCERLAQLMCSKSRLTPLKGPTIPRLELLASLIGCRLSSCLLTNTTYVWTDSQIALAWITGGKMSHPPFIQRRLQEIRSYGFRFNYIPTSINPAAIATRGLTMSQLRDSKLWWHGPPFLLESEERWPNKQESIVDEEEKLNIASFCLPQITERGSVVGPDPLRYSSWKRMIATLIIMITFIRNIAKNSVSLQGRLVKPTNRNSSRANKIALLEMQRRCPPSTDDIMNLSNCQPKPKPIYILRSDPTSRLVILDKDERCQHESTSHTLNALRMQFWIPTGRATVRKALNSCLSCKKRNTPPLKLPPIPQLPTSRVRAKSPFENVGIYYTGPFNVLVSGGMVRKIWVVLITCLTIRAIHLEISTSLSLEEFLRAIRRFIARRGRPSIIISDNGTNFKGADPPDPTASLDRYCSKEGIEWRFIPANSSWVGGVYERLIGSDRQFSTYTRRADTVTTLLFDLSTFSFHTLYPAYQRTAQARQTYRSQIHGHISSGV
uniref:Integrase catalytic domain-containing protein n=1 Tax=Heterorhabditis bacteriophora TaxID=37862 RepID=A0A1I7WGV1_HETBA